MFKEYTVSSIRKLALPLAAIVLIGCGSPGFKETADRVVRSGEQMATTMEIAAGLRQALEIGITEGAEALSAKDGYLKGPYKILLPPEAQMVADRLQFVPGFSSVETILVERLNRAAEDAAARATPIFKEAIRNMSIRDAMGILMGADNAATEYLRMTSYDKLYAAFSPVIIDSLDRFHARSYWADAATAFNRLPLEQTANPDLDDYVVNAALEGLFAMIEKKEIQIRTDVNARSTALLQRVFARQDNGQPLATD